jgi:hypothetical protein
VTAPATRDDLRWWLDLATTLRWTFAKTYADSAPHWYVVAGRTEAFELADAIRAGRVIRTYGEPGRFYSMTNLYLPVPGRLPMKCWAMWGDEPKDADADLINLATTDRTYGPQSDFDQARLAALRLPPVDRRGRL